jgi:hypothetical protein
MQETITKYQSKFDRLMTSIEEDKSLKKMPGNATAGIAVQMIKSLKSYLKANKAWIKVDIRSENSAYITIGKWVIYIDNSTGEKFIDSWEE